MASPASEKTIVPPASGLLSAVASRRAVIKGAAAFGAGAAALAAGLPVDWASAQTAGGNVVVAGIGEPKFDPYYLNTEITNIQATLFRALYDFRGSDPYTINNALAESDQETDTTLTVTLRKGVKFHNGREVVAQDVLDNIVRAKDASIGHNLSAIFGPTVTDAVAVDQYTVKLTYATTYPTKREDLVYLFLIPKEAMAELATHPVGCGPFTFTSYAPGDKLVMTKFPDYYETGKPYLDSVTVKVIADPEAQIANLSAGAVDVVTSVPVSDVSRLKTDSSVQLMQYPAGGVWNCILLNCATKPFDNLLVRQALNYTVDREKITNFAYFGQYPVTQTRYLPTVRWYDKTADTYYSYDINKAKSLLSQAGFPNGFETTINVSDAIPGSSEMAQVWVQDLASAGVTAKIQQLDQTAFFDVYFKHNFSIAAYTLGDGTIDPATYLANNSPLRTEDNTCGIETQSFFAEYKQLLTQGASSIDPAVRKPIYDRVQELSAEQGWVINLAFVQTALALAPRIQGYQTDITQVTNLTGAWIKS